MTLKLKQGKNGHGVFTDQKIPKHTFVLTLQGFSNDRKASSYNAIQTGTDKFKHDSGEGELAYMINHSCDPNIIIRYGKELFALKDISENEELTFDYETTEYDMVTDGCDFKCNCGSEKCRGQIRGWRYQ